MPAFINNRVTRVHMQALRTFFAVAIAALLAAAAAAAGSASPEGTWRTEDRRGVIRIGSCGGTLCGRIVGMQDPAPDGVPAKDVQGRPQCGLEIIHDIRPGDPGEWNATITNPEDGKVYGARLSLDEAGRLRLRGYLQVPLLGAALGSTQVWTSYGGRVTADCRMAGEP
jgi:uncharacterized protein (DUF2147 family)